MSTKADPSLDFTVTPHSQVEYGDWQTPYALAEQVCSIVSQWIQPDVVIEPNCGKGAFLKAAMQAFPRAEQFWGADICEEYVQTASDLSSECRMTVEHEDFFDGKWENIIAANHAKRILVVGNPPWVTNSELMRRESVNLPQKTNFHGLSGMDAITGKSNFDISEWMLIREAEALQNKNAVLAMLCKTSTARKVMQFLWKNNIAIAKAEIRHFDVKRFFDVSVDACLFLVDFNQNNRREEGCAVFDSLTVRAPSHVFGIHGGKLVSDIAFIRQHPHLIVKQQSRFCWRSGVKHDCAKIMELTRDEAGRFRNGLHETVDIEPDLLFPMMKSSDVANSRIGTAARYMIVPQRYVGEETRKIASLYPKTWEYLQKHLPAFEKRKSAIYRNRPPFSIFGVGDYTFSPWKVAISGLYKNLTFQAIGPHDNKPVVLDDTCYFMPCDRKEEAVFLAKVLNAKPAEKLLNALIFFDSKRPVTKDVLNQINIGALAGEIGESAAFIALYPTETVQKNIQMEIFD